MSRRERANADSLELLLDTICNVFGGIIFIAIIVALLTASRAAGVRHETEFQGAKIGDASLTELRLRIIE